MDIRYLILDVDGTLTDGKLYINESGEIFKVFNVKDGYALTQLLPSRKIIPIIISGRSSNALEYRLKELKITDYFLNCENKALKLKEICEQHQVTYSQIAYIGDDDNDYEAMKLCKFKACPINSSERIKEIADFISDYQGGDGAVRQCVEQMIKIKQYK